MRGMRGLGFTGGGGKGGVSVGLETALGSQLGGGRAHEEARQSEMGGTPEIGCGLYLGWGGQENNWGSGKIFHERLFTLLPKML